MLIAEALDTLLTLGRWAIAWTVVLATVGTIILGAAALTGAWVWRTAWRGVVRPSWAYGRARAHRYAARRARRSRELSAPSTYKEAA